MDLEISMILIIIKVISKPRDWGKLFKKEKIQKDDPNLGKGKQPGRK